MWSMLAQSVKCSTSAPGLSENRSSNPYCDDKIFFIDNDVKYFIFVRKV